MYIHQTKDWPNFSWDKDAINAKLAKVNKAAGFLAGRLSTIGFDAQMNAAVETLTHDILASSEIEGVVLNSDQVRSSVARRMGVHIVGDVEPSHYIEGVVEMMMDATRKYDQPLTDDRLFGWHNCLFPTGRSGMAVINVGKYRMDPMEVVSGTLDREKVHYQAPSADVVPFEMKKFLDWFNADLTPKNYIKSAVAHFWFVSIHPFDDGNGRISRAIADMALSQADDSTLRFFSISRQINKDKRKYNDILERCQKGGCDITLWIDWYLDCMSRAIESAGEMLSSILDKSIFWQTHSQVVVSDRQKTALNIYLDGYCGKLNVKNWAKQVKVSDDTAGRDVKDLVEKGILIPQPGRVRDVSYGISVSADKTLVPGSNAVNDVE
ncbi:MAG: Fic family protein [Candidatus Cryptobacteroides sp.]|nr:Fic family protein [Candidatus Cryptobacteroides sp.]